MNRIGCTLSLLLSILSGCKSQARFSCKGNITLGVLLPLHLHAEIDSCGEFYSFGLGYTEAIMYTISQINQNDSLLPGIDLGIEVWDYCDTQVLAVKWAHQIGTNNFLNEVLQTQAETNSSSSSLTSAQLNLTSPIVAVLGIEDSSSSSLVSSLLQVVGIATISPFATSEELSSPYYNTFFRTIPPDGQQAKAMVDIIEYFGWEYVAVVAVDYSYGRYGVRALERESYHRKSFCIAMVEYFTRSGYKGQIASIVEKLKRESNIQVVVFWSNYEPARRFLEEATHQKLIGRTFLVSEALAMIGKDVLERHSSVLGSSLGMIPHQYEDETFINYLKNMTPGKSRQCGNPWWREFWETSFNCTTANQSETRKPCDESMTVGDTYHKLYNSFVPYLSDAVYSIAHALNLMLRCDKNKCEGSLKIKELAKYMKNVSFKGLTGDVRFNSEGNPTNSFYDVVNFQHNTSDGRYSIIPIGSWQGKGNSDQLLINRSAIRWNTKGNRAPESTCSKTCPAGYKKTDTVACCWECLPCPEGTVNPYPGQTNCTRCPREQMSNPEKTKCIDLRIFNIQWDDPIAIVIEALTIMGLLVAFLATGVYVFFRDTPIVKASNRELSFLLLCIIILCFVLSFLHLIYPSESLCFIIIPWRYITCTACVSILYLKTNRLVNAFQVNLVPSWFKKYVLDRKRQLVVAFLLNVIQFVFTVLWLTIDPPYMYKEIRTQEYIFLTCRPFQSSIGLVIRSIMFVYFIFLACLCTLYAFKARGLPENFSEARYIGFSMYILLVSWIVYYPVDSTLEGSYITIVACATALLTAYGLLGCLFVPKIYIMLKHPDKNTVAFVKAEVGQFSNTFRATVPASLHVHAINRVIPATETLPS